MKLDRFEKGALTLLVGILIYIVSFLVLDQATLTETWRNILLWMIGLGLVVFLIGWVILIHAPIFKTSTKLPE